HSDSAPLLYLFFLYCSGAHRDLHSFPTRRSSDLSGRWVLAKETRHNAHGSSLAQRGDRSAPSGSWICASRRLVVPLRLATANRSDRKSTRLNSSHDQISYAVFCLKKKKTKKKRQK